jgi:mRNA interferase YafQ
MLKIEYHSKFKKDYKRAVKRGCDVQKIQAVVKLLAEQKTLPEKYKDHELVGEYKGYRECHITPDWLLIYKVKDSELVLLLVRTGSHSDLFKK